MRMIHREPTEEKFLIEFPSKQTTLICHSEVILKDA